MSTKLIRSIADFGLAPYKGHNGVLEVSEDMYDSMINSGQGEPLCSNDPEIAGACLAEAAMRWEAEITTEDEELYNICVHYGAAAQLKKGN